MTDKEIIEIDGINVLECEHYQYKSLKDCEMRYPESGDCEIGLINYLFNGNLDMEKLCVDNPNCYFKQLARKTQECEGLKEKLACQININNHLADYQVTANKLMDCYCKALEEIEEVIKSPCAEDCVYYEPSRCYDCIKTSILDIISKAKERENE